ncbi:helix-turn-helix domain-containing protein [Trinickia diaoshuihuensis]|uniref:helix-turn-helix domain-containing protein n=1 Tax=Trinickia diaoshuihuensis TaxID=2292265 RepID=UPI000E2878C8|nr:XRE family transcriptional regulator [Trinickia diaoshuihuensis]
MGRHRKTYERGEWLEEERPSSTVLGPKIRSLRQHLSLTLDEVATSAGISAPFLSQVERGLARPSVSTLMAIARVLGVKIQYLLDAPRDERYVARGDRLTFFGFADADNRFARLTQVTEGGQMEALLVRIPAGQKLDKITARAGEQFWYVLSGNLTLTLEDKTYEFREGDSAHYDSTDAHHWHNTGEQDALLMWVGTPSLL